MGGSGGALGELEDLKNTHFLGLAELWEALGELWDICPNPRNPTNSIIYFIFVLMYSLPPHLYPRDCNYNITAAGAVDREFLYI